MSFSSMLHCMELLQAGRQPQRVNVVAKQLLQVACLCCSMLALACCRPLALDVRLVSSKERCRLQRQQHLCICDDKSDKSDKSDKAACTGSGCGLGLIDHTAALRL